MQNQTGNADNWSNLMKDNADYWLEQMMRVAENPAFKDESEREDALHSLVDRLAGVATASDADAGQSIFNRAFHHAKAAGHISLSRDIDQLAQYRGFKSPEAFSLEC